jgi:hypothetical protein
VAAKSVSQSPRGTEPLWIRGPTARASSEVSASVSRFPSSLMLCVADTPHAFICSFVKCNSGRVRLEQFGTLFQELGGTSLAVNTFSRSFLLGEHLRSRGENAHWIPGENARTVPEGLWLILSLRLGRHQRSLSQFPGPWWF